LAAKAFLLLAQARYRGEDGSMEGRWDPATKSYVCLHVFRRQRPVLLVSRPEGDWCFLCGEDDHADEAAEFRVVCMGDVVEPDPSLTHVLGLEAGEEAERPDGAGGWARSRISG
jgi:hypothetical protein